jgi:hypothetical protein
MARFLDILFKEAPNGYLLRSTVIHRFNEAGVPITWPRMASLKTYFEKKNVMPPFALTQKFAIIVKLRDTESNVQRVEECIVNMITKRIDRD